jgi:hypothetical protein
MVLRRIRKRGSNLRPGGPTPSELDLKSVKKTCRRDDQSHARAADGTARDAPGESEIAAQKKNSQARAEHGTDENDFGGNRMPAKKRQASSVELLTGSIHVGDDSVDSAAADAEARETLGESRGASVLAQQPLGEQHSER